MYLYHVGRKMPEASRIRPFQFLEAMSAIGPVEDLAPWLSLAVNRSTLWEAMFRVCEMTKIGGMAQEVVFEAFRQRYFPGAPSRFLSSFYVESIKEAERYRDDFRKGLAIHRCKVIAGTPIERDMALITEGFQNLKATEAMHLLEHRAVDYWEASLPKKRPEILVCGDVEVTDTVG